MSTPPVYATLTDLATYGVSANALQFVAQEEQTDALQGASGVVASALSARFVMPLVSWGNDINRAVSIIAAYDLMFVRGYNPSDGPDEQLEKRFQYIQKWLDRVREGKETPQGIQDSSALAATDPGGGGAFTRQMVILGGGNPPSSQSLNGAPPSVSNGPAGYVFVGAPRSRGW